MSLTRHDGHRHLGSLPAFPFYGGPPVDPAPQAPADVAALLSDLDLDRDDVERALVLPNYGIPAPEIAFQHNDLVLEACAGEKEIKALKLSFLLGGAPHDEACRPAPGLAVANLDLSGVNRSRSGGMNHLRDLRPDSYRTAVSA